MDEREKADLERWRKEAEKLKPCKEFEGVYLPNGCSLSDAVYVGGFVFEAGCKQFDEWSKKVIEYLGDDIAPSLNLVWNKARMEYLRLTVALEARMKEIAEEESKQEFENRKQADRSAKGVRPVQPLLFDGPMQTNEQQTAPTSALPTKNHAKDKLPEPKIEHPTTQNVETKPAQKEEAQWIFKLPEGFPEGYGSNNKVINHDELKEAVNRFLQKHGESHFDPDEQDLKDMLYVGLFFFEGSMIEYKFVEYDSWAETVKTILGQAVGPHLDELWKRTRKEYRRQYVLPEPEEMSIKENTDAEDRQPSYIEETHKYELKELFQNTEILNWSIGVYYVIYFIGSWALLPLAPALSAVFILFPFLLLTWQIVIIREQYIQEKEYYSISNIYECVGGSDLWRIFWIVLILHWPLASKYVLGFFVFSGIVVVLLGLLTYGAICEFLRHKTATPLLIGCIAFGHFLLSWEKETFVIHYGVPVIGHFFEKPEYDTKYYVEIKSEDSGRKYKVIADIHVEGESVTEDVGDGYYGQLLSHTFEYRYACIRRLYFPNGSSVLIEEQDWLLSLDESTFVRDSQGHKWYVTLLNEPVGRDKPFNIREILAY